MPGNRGGESGSEAGGITIARPEVPYLSNEKFVYAVCGAKPGTEIHPVIATDLSEQDPFFKVQGPEFAWREFVTELKRNGLSNEQDEQMVEEIITLPGIFRRSRNGRNGFNASPTNVGPSVYLAARGQSRAIFSLRDGDKPNNSRLVSDLSLSKGVAFFLPEEWQVSITRLSGVLSSKILRFGPQRRSLEPGETTPRPDEITSRTPIASSLGSEVLGSIVLQDTIRARDIPGGRGSDPNTERYIEAQRAIIKRHMDSLDPNRH